MTPDDHGKGSIPYNHQPKWPSEAPGAEGPGKLLSVRGCVPLLLLICFCAFTTNQVWPKFFTCTIVLNLGSK